MAAKELFTERKFFENKHIITLKELVKGCSVYLTGGAVIDILDGRTPKDFDFYVPDKNYLLQLSNVFYQRGATFLYSSKTSLTFGYKGLVVQLLKTNLEEFDYTINASWITLNTQAIHNFDIQSYVFRVLVPTPYAFEKPYKSKDAIKRLPKMEGKGFSLPKISEKSLKSNYKWYSFLFPNNTNS